MSIALSFSQQVTEAFQVKPRGIVGLVDALLDVSRRQAFRIEWSVDRCRIAMMGQENPVETEIVVPKSVFRAALARIAAMCNERIPNSVRPYGGEGVCRPIDGVELDIPISLTNTPNEQWLEIGNRHVFDSKPRNFRVMVRETGDATIRVIDVSGYGIRRLAPKSEGETSWLGVLAEPGNADNFVALFQAPSVLAAYCSEAK